MRIAFVVHGYPPAIGGAERYAEGLANQLAVMGHEVHVVAPLATSAEAFYERGHIARTIDQVQGDVHVLRIPIREPRGSGGYKSALASRVWSSYGKSLRAKLSAIDPQWLVALPHAFPNVSETVGRTPFRTLYAPMLHEHDPSWNVEQIADLVQKSDAVLAMTEWGRHRLIAAYGANADRTGVAPPGVVAPKLESVSSAERGRPYFVAVGRRVESKGLDLVSEAIASLRADGHDIEFLIVGPGDDRKDAEFGPKDGTVVVGQVEETAKWSLLKGAVATVSMSVAESFGITTVESWKMGTPVLVRRTGVTESLVKDKLTGFLIDEPQGLTNRLRELLVRPHLSKEMGQAGLAAAEQFTWSRTATTVEALFDTDAS